METAPELVTVYRSMDLSAKEDCEAIAARLTAEGFAAAVHDDSQLEVPVGTYAVRVPAEQGAKAEEIMAAQMDLDGAEDVDPGPGMDLETIFHSEGSTTAEFEANFIQNVLESEGVAAVIVGDSVLPNFPFEVRVATEQADKARQIVEEALASGPAAADAAELESERGGPVQ